MSNLRETVARFNIVRRGANREVGHVVRIGSVSHFQMSRDTREFGDAYCRLPAWLRRLAVFFANREAKP